MKRRPNESFKDYKKRREMDQGATQIALRPKVFWPSRRLGSYRKDGKLDQKYLEKVHRGHFPGGSVESSGDTEGGVDKADLGGDGGDK